MATVVLRDWPSVRFLRNLFLVARHYDDIIFNQAWVVRRIGMLEQALLPNDAPEDPPLSCRVARQSDCGRQYLRWMDEFGQRSLLDRKCWEWSAIARALETAGCLEAGRKGLGFAVGTEPLAATFAGKGCDIVATDLDASDHRADAWVATGQHFGAMSEANVTYRAVDMKAIPADLSGFDFVWSSCAFEHLGSLEAGMAFVESAMKCLRPGGWAVHTTEFNLNDEGGTVDRGQTVFYRRQDMLRLKERLERSGHAVQPFGAAETQWQGAVDAFIDVPPYQSTSFVVRSKGVRTTSFVLVVQAGSPS